MSGVTERKGRGGGREQAKGKGQEIVEGLRDLADALQAEISLETKFTVRMYKIAPPPEYRGEQTRRVRDLLGMSQAAFAAFLGVDPSTIQSWEQGRRAPNPMACRLLSEIEADPTHWRSRLSACLIGPSTRGPDPDQRARTRSKRRTPTA